MFPYAFFFFWSFRILGILALGPQNRLIYQYLTNKKKEEKAASEKIADEKFRELEVGCMVCKKKFGLLNRKQRCKVCGDLVCAKCSMKKMSVKFVSEDREGAAKAAATTTRKSVKCCDLCFQGVKVIKPSARKIKWDDGDDKFVLKKMKSVGNALGSGVISGGELVGKGVGLGLSGGELVGKGLVGLGRSSIAKITSKYHIEVPIRRSITKKYIDRPDVQRSHAIKLKYFGQGREASEAAK